MRRWGRFSVYGSADFESYMSTLFDAIVERTEGILTPNLSHSLILLGGYGRGEGGVVQTDKGERPHNNLDFLLITSSISSKKQARLSAQIREALRPLEQSYGIEFDLASITESKLRRSPCLVI